MRIGVAAGLWATFSMLPAAAQQSPPRPPERAPLGCAGDPRQDQLEGATDDGDLILGSEGLARLVSVRLANDPAHRQQALAWLKAQSGHHVLIVPQGSRDRWGRLPVRVRATDRTGGLDLSHGLVEAGLAIVDPGADSVLCQPELLSLEETARERHLGLWADGRYNPIPVDQADRLKKRVGSFVIVEGRVRSVGERKQRTYLNFGGQWADDFTIIIPRKTWMLMAERGLSPERLKGHIIRARGILQSWQGTALSVDLPEMIERLDDENLQDRKRDDGRLAP